MDHHQVYIGLGSNLGDRLKFLQQAITAIHLKVGPVEAVSSIYETPSVGFEGPDFFNACCRVKSALNPGELLEVLRVIETDLGRKEKTKETYTSRKIDLDILFYDQDVIHVQDSAKGPLIIPHPRLAQRRFVLEPLNEIAPKLSHPQLKKSIDVLLENCSDRTEIRLTNHKLQIPQDRGLNPASGFIAIEGNIGSGKTSLAEMIAKDFNGHLMLEEFKDNYFLPKFYQEPERYAFTLEMSFLRDRHQQWEKRLSEMGSTGNLLISDYSIKKSLIFSKINLKREEYLLYKSLFHQLNKTHQDPEATIYLHQDVHRLKENIAKRGRAYEQHISLDYLKRIQDAYLDFLNNETNSNVKIIDLKDKDFVNSKVDYEWVINEIGTIF